MTTEQQSLKKTARLAGLFYLVAVLTGPFTLLYVPSKTIVKGDVIATAARMLANESLFRWGMALGIVGGVAFFLAVFVQYKLFKHVNDYLAKLMLILVAMQMPVGFVTDAFSITALYIFKGEALKELPVLESQSIAMLLLRMSHYATYLLETLWGLWLIPFGLLIIKSDFIPRIIGIYLILNGIAYVLIAFSFILYPQYQSIIEKYTFPLLFGEMIVMLWFVVIGARFQKEQTTK